MDQEEYFSNEKKAEEAPEARAAGEPAGVPMKLGYGAGAIADYPWHLDGSSPWLVSNSISVLEILQNLKSIGVCVVDTAHRYGGGISEAMVGIARACGVLNGVEIMTKIDASDVTSEMERAFQTSCVRLGGAPDSVLLHNPDLSKRFKISIAIDWLKSKNLKSIGISTEPSRDAIYIAKQYGLDVIQFPYSLWDRRAEDEIFPFIGDDMRTVANRVLGGPAKVKNMATVTEALDFLVKTRARIDVALIGTGNFYHLTKCVEAFNELRASS